MTDWEAIRREVMKRDGPGCHSCHRRPGEQLHHTILRRSKRCPQLHHPLNLSLVCMKCHMEGGVDSKQYRQDFIAYLGRIGLGGELRAWVEGLPLKDKADLYRLVA